jgi:hypothetical protein
MFKVNRKSRRLHVGPLFAFDAIRVTLNARSEAQEATGRQAWERFAEATLTHQPEAGPMGQHLAEQAQQ